MKNRRLQNRLYGSVNSFLFGLVLAALIPFTSPLAQVTDQVPDELERIGIDEHLGETIDLSLQFTDETGRAVTLADYFHQDKPVLLSLVYFTCPMLCNLTMNGMNDAFGQLAWLPGEEYEVVSVSIHPDETPKLALAKKNNYLTVLNRPGAENGWHFLTGSKESSEALAAQIGFRYFWNEAQEQYAHASAIYILTADGSISRYLYGISFPERDLRLGLVEAGDGKIGSSYDQLLLYCFHYDPDARGYVAVAENIMRLGGGLTLATVILLVGGLFWRERKKSHSRARTVSMSTDAQQKVS